MNAETNDDRIIHYSLCELQSGWKAIKCSLVLVTNERMSAEENEIRMVCHSADDFLRDLFKHR